MRFSTVEQKIEFKQQLKAACLQLLQQRIKNINTAIAEAREASNSEEKSSAGDKYEVSRAMGHLSQEMQGHQLEEAQNNLSFINSLNPETIYADVTTGAVVISNQQTFFICQGLGTVTPGNEKITLLSPKAPLAAALMHKKAGDTVSFNGKTLEITEVF